MPHMAYLKQETGSPEERMIFEFFSERQQREMHWYTKYKVHTRQGSYLMYFATDPIKFLFRKLPKENT